MRKMEDLSIYLDDYMLTEVLKRLNVKTLLQFRCVCKRWNNIIHQPYFANLHRNYYLSPCTLLYFFHTIPYFDPISSRRSKLYFYTLDYHHGKASHYFSIDSSDIGFRTIDSISDVVNGLVCINNFNRVVVCNITTHEFISLPKTRRRSYDIKMAPNLSRKRARCVPHYSFGFDLLTKEYKVLRIWLNSIEGFIRCELFTVGTSKRWRKINAIPTNIEAIQSKSIYIRGSLYWLDRQLIKFDIQKEIFRTIDVPQSVSRGVCCYPIQVGGGFGIRALNCIHILDEEKDVWVRKDFVIGKTKLVGSSATRLFFLNDDRYHNYRATTLYLLCYDHEGMHCSSTNITGSLPPIGSYGLLRLPSTAITEHVENIYPLTRS